MHPDQQKADRLLALYTARRVRLWRPGWRMQDEHMPATWHRLHRAVWRRIAAREREAFFALKGGE